MNQKKLWNYWPLFILVAIAAMAGAALTWGKQEGVSHWMHYFMGIFFCQFAMIKLFNPAGFAEGFQRYDLIAKNMPLYGFVYPWLELGLGLLYLSESALLFTYILTIIVALVSAIGVIKALRQGLDTRCACMGTILNVPLSSVTLSEDIAMGFMALLMLLYT